MPPEFARHDKLVVDKLVNAGIPTVLVVRDIVTFPERSGLPLVAYDNRRGGYLLADHQIKRGCRRIDFIASPHAQIKRATFPTWRSLALHPLEFKFGLIQ